MLKEKYVNTSLKILALSIVAISAPAFAGQVNVALDSNNQIIATGSADADRLVVRTFSSGSTFLIARSGTTLNFQGNTSNRIRLPANDRIIIRTRGGNDLVVVRDAVAPRLNVNLGGGNDRLILRGDNQLAGGFADGGSGRDTVTGELAGATLRAGSFENDNSTSGGSTPPPPTPPVNNPNNLPVVQVGTSGTFPASSSRENLLGSQLFVMTEVPSGSLISFTDFNATSGLSFLGDSVGQDILDVSAIDADITRPGNQAFTIVDEFTGEPGQLRVPQGRFDTADGLVILSMRFDRDGDGVSDFRIAMVNEVIRDFVRGPWTDNIIP